MPRFIGTRCGVNSTGAPMFISISGVWRWSSRPYAVTSSSTVQNVVVGLGGRPAPDTPDDGVDDDAVGGDQPRTHQRRHRERRRGRVAAGRRDAVGAAQLRRGTARAGRRRTGRAARGGCGRRRTTARSPPRCGSRKSAPRSTITRTRPSRSGTISWLVPCGRPRNTTSTPSSSSGDQRLEHQVRVAAGQARVQVGDRGAGLGVTRGERRPGAPGAGGTAGAARRRCSPTHR